MAKFIQGSALTDNTLKYIHLNLDHVKMVCVKEEEDNTWSIYADGVKVDNSHANQAVAEAALDSLIA